MTKKKRTTEPKSIIVAFDWFDHRIYRGIGKFCIENHWHLAPYFFSDRHLPEKWTGDGAITCYGDVMAKFIKNLDMPKVDVSFRSIPQNIPRITVDNEQIGRLAAEHFINRGYRNFAYFSWDKVKVNQIRKKCFFDALRDKGVKEESLFLIEQPGIKIIRDWPKQRENLAKQLHALPRPLAVFTGQDNLGVELTEVCKHSGISVPEEIAILGVDNVGFQCDCAAVPLSSIDTHMEELGYTAAEQLKRLFDGEITMDEPDRIIPVGPVVTRRSTDSLAVTHSKVVEALKLMRSNFAQGLVLDEVLSHVGMSKRGLEKAFQKALGRSPAAELRRMRLEFAKQLLLRTDLKVEAIAIECGYSNASNLSHALRREIQMSPNQYRDSYRAENQW